MLMHVHESPNCAMMKIIWSSFIENPWFVACAPRDLRLILDLGGQYHKCMSHMTYLVNCRKSSTFRENHVVDPSMEPVKVTPNDHGQIFWTTYFVERVHRLHSSCPLLVWSLNASYMNNLIQVLGVWIICELQVIYASCKLWNCHLQVVSYVSCELILRVASWKSMGCVLWLDKSKSHDRCKEGQPHYRKSCYYMVFI